MERTPLDSWAIAPQTNDIFGNTDDDAMFGLLDASVIQPLRRAVTTRWDAKSPEPLLRWFDAWHPAVLSDAAVEELQVKCVLPKLQRAVEAWNPLKDPVQIHAWLHPWLPSLGASMASLWAPIRHKLTNALAAWHPSDQSALGRPVAHRVRREDWDALLFDRSCPSSSMRYPR